MGKPFKSGFVALLGAPNAGKSTLLNRLLGEKLSITSPKPQTTRNRIMGVVHRDEAQMVILDLPGIHKASGPLNRHMVQVAMDAAADVDLILFMVDASRPDPEAEEMVLEKLAEHKGPVILVLNKIDLLEKPALLPLLSRWNEAFDFKALLPVSARTGEQVEELFSCMENALPEGAALFPEDTLTDLPERFLAAEVVREKVFRLTGQELPYATAVTVEAFEEQESPPFIRISALIHVEKDSQKGILVGSGGAMIKKIGTQARRDLESMLGVKVFLSLLVRVERNWSRSVQAMKRMGYE
ncbi:MAG: GTPase Era [Thermodesulfobacteriota bacterium]